MKTTILILAFFITPMIVSANYVVDFSNPMTYQTSCGNVQPSQWTVSGQTCELLLPPLKATTETVITVNYLFRINQSGNLYKWDNLILMYKLGINGVWQADTTITGQIQNNVRDISGSFNLKKGDTLHFKVVAYTRSTSGFWAVKTGDINISGVTPVYFPLPVELLDFSGEYNIEEKLNELSWSTASETNNSHFILERSDNGFSYKPVAIIEGSGNSNMLLHYKYNDENPDQNYYYRLTQVDFDGKSETFKPIFIDVSGETKPLISNVWVSDNTVHYDVSDGSTGVLLIELTDISGRVIHKEIISADDNNGNQIRLDYSDGTMVLLIVTDEAGNRDMKKLITL